MKLARVLWLLVLVALAVMAAGCTGGGTPPGSADKGGQVPAEPGCVSCHTDKDKLLKGLEANPVQLAEKSEETEGEG